MFAVAGEVVTILAASIPVLSHLAHSLANGAVPFVLATCILVAGAMAVIFSGTEREHIASSGSAAADAPAGDPHRHRKPDAVGTVAQAWRNVGGLCGEEHARRTSSHLMAESPRDHDITAQRAREDEHSDLLCAGSRVQDSLALDSRASGTASSGATGHRNGYERETRAETKAIVRGAAYAAGKWRDAKTRAAAAAPAPTSLRDIPENGSMPKPRRHYRRGGEVLYIAEGVVQAAVGLVRDPVHGARYEGVKGLMKGVGSGLVGVVGRPARGVARAGANAYTGARIGLTRAGRAVGASGGRAAGRMAGANQMVPVRSQGQEAELGRRSPSPPDLRASRSSRGGSPSPAAEEGRKYIARSNGLNTVHVAAEPKENGRLRASLKSRHGSPLMVSLDGLTIGVATVPLILSSVLIMVDSGRLNPAPCAEDSPPSTYLGGALASSSTQDNGAEWREYLEVVLEGSVLCAASEIILALQGVVRVWRHKSALRNLVTSGPLRMTVLAVGCALCCRRPLLPLWCIAVYDVTRRGLEFAMRRLSLRSGEAAVLAQALTLWAVDALLYTIQEVWLAGPNAWEAVFPYIPQRSDSMIVVQTGLLGTLVTGMAMAATRLLVPTAWATGRKHHVLMYAVLVGGTFRWLLKWTAPLLGLHPVVWALMYALGIPPGATKFGFQTISDTAATQETTSLATTTWSTLVATRNVIMKEGIDLVRPMLVMSWVAALAIGVPLTPSVSRRLSLSKTVSRKVFHALATVMFVPAIALERSFLSVALGAAIGIMLALEFLRCAECAPVARVLNAYYGSFLDARDGGSLIVTHLFLLLGCATPVWLSGLAGDHAGVLPYTGVVVLGIGDAMGAWVGSTVGRVHWPSSRRTLEGSAAVFLSTLIALSMCSHISSEQAPRGTTGWASDITGLLWPVAIASLVEAFTAQVDNLVLPCVLFTCVALPSNKPAIVDCP